jgi:hypothetical protein
VELVKACQDKVARGLQPSGKENCLVHQASCLMRVKELPLQPLAKKTAFSEDKEDEDEDELVSWVKPSVVGEAVGPATDLRMREVHDFAMKAVI